MTLRLDDLYLYHAKLRGHPTDYAKCGAISLQRSSHISPVKADIDHDGEATSTQVLWSHQDATVFDVIDSNRLTEDGAEAVALSYVHFKAAWVVKRRLQRGESADWLLNNASGWLALEVSGTVSGDPLARLAEKKEQVSRCTLPAQRLAIVVAFNNPSILVSTP